MDPYGAQISPYLPLQQTLLPTDKSSSPLTEKFKRVLNEQNSEKTDGNLSPPKFMKLTNGQSSQSMEKTHKIDYFSKVPTRLLRYMLLFCGDSLRPFAITNKRHKEIARLATTDLLLEHGKTSLDVGFKSDPPCLQYLEHELRPKYCLEQYNLGTPIFKLGFLFNYDFHKYIKNVPDSNKKLKKLALVDKLTYRKTSEQKVNLCSMDAINYQLDKYPNLDSLEINISFNPETDTKAVILRIIEKIPKLKSLIVNNTKINIEWTKHLNELKALEFLEIDCTSLPNLTPFENLSHLKTLKLKNFNGIQDVFNLPEKLEHLSCDTFTQLTSFKILQAQPKLKSISLTTFHLLNNVDLKLSDSESPNSIESISIEWFPQIKDIQFLIGLKKLKKLKIACSRNFSEVLLPENIEEIEFCHLTQSNHKEDFQKLQKLQMLTLNECGSLEELQLPSEPNNLRKVSLLGLKQLTTIKPLKKSEQIRFNIKRCEKIQNSI